MRVETRTPPTAGQKAAPTVRPRPSKRLGAVLVAAVIVAGAAIGVLRNDGGSAGSAKPNTTTASEPAGTPVAPFTPLPPSSGSGVSSADG